jgi:hypothetical protein
MNGFLVKQRPLIETAGCANIIFIFWKFPGTAFQIQKKRLVGFAKPIGVRRVFASLCLAKRLVNQGSCSRLALSSRPVNTATWRRGYN